MGILLSLLPTECFPPLIIDQLLDALILVWVNQSLVLPLKIKVGMEIQMLCFFLHTRWLCGIWRLSCADEIASQIQCRGILRQMILKTSRISYLFSLIPKQFYSRMTSLTRAELICLFDVDGTLTIPRQVSLFTYYQLICLCEWNWNLFYCI